MLLGLPLALVVPGQFVVVILQPTAQGLERWALAVGCSLIVLTGDVAMASALPGGISSLTVAVTLAATTALFAALALVSNREGSVVLDRRALSRSTGSRGLWAVTGVVVAACLAGALAVSVASEKRFDAEPLTQLSLVPAAGGLLLEIHNFEGIATAYRVETTLPGDAVTTLSLTLADGETYTKLLQPSSEGEVVVRLFGGSTTALGYHEVRVAAP
ncbi:hypothetical protein JOD57_002814 [Geodermatophilus bullaregiensis]|uniref:hypothetical protein n=1 Tax=Geodermatophilus bullaregiensis TaxID=1564160 RepID=UPI003555F001|nr:hypothetical protein [Geodermatophilus bullaregiensis]